MYNTLKDMIANKVLKIFSLSVCVLLLTAASFSTYANGISPYLPIKLSPLFENEIERLLTLSGNPRLTKPYKLSTVLAAMEEIKEKYPLLYGRLQGSLRKYRQQRGLTHLSASINSSKESHTVSNKRGTYTDSNANVAFQTQWQVKDWLGVFVGGYITQYQDDVLDRNIQASGSMVSMGTDWAQLDIGYKDIWLSPFIGSAQLLSTNAETLPSISLSNNLPLDTYGVKWNYQAFLAQTSRQLVQFKPGEFSDKDKPLISGLHFSFHPTDWWTVGATRIFQFGGGNRPISAGTLARAFFDPRGSDNDATVDQESGNQIAAISSKINFDGNLPFSFSIELAGEDTSNNKAYQLGNPALTVGLYFPYFLSEHWSLAYEYSDWQDQWYVNNVYQDGYVNQGFVLGHWAMQPQRENSTATAGQSHLIETHWQSTNSDVISMTLKTSENQDTNLTDYSNAWELDLKYTFPWQSHTVSIGTYIGKDSYGENFKQLTASWEL